MPQPALSSQFSLLFPVLTTVRRIIHLGGRSVNGEEQGRSGTPGRLRKNSRQKLPMVPFQHQAKAHALHRSTGFDLVDMGE